jgi:ABC-type Fe3+ transport system, periplasmic component
MNALVAAAKKEGTLNVIALPPTWANYGAILSAFTTKYGIKINSTLPDGTSQQEVNAVKTENGTAKAPDVLDVGQAVALANTSLFAPYKVATWSAIPAAQKEASGLWYEDYGGYMAIGYSSKFGTITSLNDLLGPKFKNAVALNGNPTSANAALNGVMMANLASGRNGQRHLQGRGLLLQAQGSRQLLPRIGDRRHDQGRHDPGRVQLGLPQPLSYVGVSNWKVFVPQGVALGGYYTQAINKQAPHPAAARLWEEFLYSQAASGGQNLWIEGGARPVEQLAMANNGSLNHGGRQAAVRLRITGVPHPGPEHRRCQLPGGELGEGRRLARGRGCRCDN